MRIVERTGECWFAAELNRHKGQLLLRRGQPEAAEQLYHKALSIAREQEAKLWELRATVSLAQLRRNQGRHAEVQSGEGAARRTPLRTRMMETIASTGADVRLSDSATTRAIVWLTAWDSQGFHRTATSGDEAGADWLIREAAGIGAAPEVEKFALDRFDLIDAYLEFDGTRIPGIPVFDAPATGGDGVAGALGPIEAEPGIAVAELSPRSVYTGDYEKLRLVTRSTIPISLLVRVAKFEKIGSRQAWQAA